MWDRIPQQVIDEIDSIVDFTKRTGREAAITICVKKERNPDRYFVGNEMEGDKESSEVLSCNTKFGNAVQVADVHTHPPELAIGILPSDADIQGNLEESQIHDVRTISCIANSYAPYIGCFQPKHAPTREQLQQYEKALSYKTSGTYESSPYIRDNVYKDFIFSYFHYNDDRDKRGQIVAEPEPKKVVKCALGKMTSELRQKIKDSEKGAFCQLVNDLTVPDDPRVEYECRAELKRRQLFGGLVSYDMGQRASCPI